MSLRVVPSDRNAALRREEEGHLWNHVHLFVRKRRLVVAAWVSVSVLGVLRVLLISPVYQATTQLLIERESPNVLAIKQVAQVDAERDDYYQTQYKLIESRELARRVIQKLKLLGERDFGGPRTPEQIGAIETATPSQTSEMERAIDRFVERTTVQPVRNSRLVRVSFDASRAQLAAQVVNELASAYIQHALDLRMRTSTEAGKWLAAQIDDQRKKVEAIETSLLAFKEKQGIVNIEERRELLDQKLKDLGSTLNKLRAERLQAEALHGQMQRAPNPQELPEVMRSPVIQGLRGNLAELERQEAQLLEKYLTNHPQVQKVRSQIEQTKRKIAFESESIIRSASNAYHAAAASEASVSNDLEGAKAEALDLSRRSVQYDSLKTEGDAAKGVLNSLLARHKETDVVSELKATNIRVVDQATPPRRPIRPRYVRDTLLGIVIGLVLGALLAYLSEYMHNTITTPDDVRLHLGVPLLGVVPLVTGPEASRLVGAANDSAFAEAYRGIHTAISFSWTDKQRRVIVVTSTGAAEGKTSTAANLALTLHASGGKVVLVDCDMRKPRQQELFGLSRAPGISDILVGKAEPYRSVRPGRNTGLGVLTAGTPVPSPAHLLLTPAMSDLIEGLRSLFDWIIVDTPPIGPVADALALARLGDAAILVVGSEQLPRKAVRLSIERLKTTGTRLLGVVLNRAQVGRDSLYYGAYYGHYYASDYNTADRRAPAARRP
jgi:polysaccharide biosynthesis transport protein